MSRGRTFEKVMVENTAGQAATWLWTTDRDNHNAPNVPILPQDVVSQVEQAAFQSKARSRSPRRRQSCSAPFSLGLFFSSRTRGGDGKCQNSDLHICNYFNPEGVLRGTTGKRSCLHHVPVSSSSAKAASDVKREKGSHKEDRKRKTTERVRRCDRDEETGARRGVAVGAHSVFH